MTTKEGKQQIDDLLPFFAIAVFLSEVIDSLTRGYREKSNPDFLILEINSSRYAYNMSLKEVNFNVVKAVFAMESIIEPANDNVLVAINAVFKQLGPVVSNYIKSEDAMMDCLKALEVLNRFSCFICSFINYLLCLLFSGHLRGEQTGA